MHAESYQSTCLQVLTEFLQTSTSKCFDFVDCIVKTGTGDVPLRYSMSYY